MYVFAIQMLRKCESTSRGVNLYCGFDSGSSLSSFLSWPDWSATNYSVSGPLKSRSELRSRNWNIYGNATQIWFDKIV